MIKIPIFEYRCIGCDNVDELLEFGGEPYRKHYCLKCGKESERIVSLSKFKLEYDPRKHICDWAGNTSHYWDEVKKQRAGGKDVKPAVDGDIY